MKQTISVILLIYICLTLSAQQFSTGSEIGIISSINTDYSLTDFENRRNTYYSGLNVNYNCNKSLTFTAGFHYLRQGHRHKTCYVFEEGIKNELVGKIDYLIIPLILNVNSGKSNKILATLGVYGAYNIKAGQDYPEPIGGCEIYYNEDLTDNTYNFSIGGIVGAGYRIFENNKLEINSRIKYYQGLRNASKYNDMEIKRKYSSALITLTLNYKITT